MRLWTLAFLIGVLILQKFTFLPSVWWSFLIVVCVIISRIFLGKYWPYIRLFTACAVGFAWCLFYANIECSWKLPENIEGKTIEVSGRIVSPPNTTSLGKSFLFSVEQIQFENATIPFHGLIHLTWHAQNLNLYAGDQWRFYTHLKKIYGTMNPGGFDYEAFALQEGIRASGYVIDKEQNIRLSHHWYHDSIDRVREFFKEKISANLPVSETSPWIMALAIGERNDIDVKEWQVLRNTGTNHLMAIAGLHIGLMAALAHFVVAGFWRRIPWLTLKIPAVHAGAVAALLMALTYSAMAGFSIPTKRACLMLCIFLAALLMRRKIPVWQAWCSAMLVVLFLNPLSVLSDSFWLSFGSVALIIYGVSGRLLPSGLWWKWGRIQWVIAVGLLPFSLWLFQQFSLVSFAANSIAIPWVGFIVVPLTLLGCFFLIFSAKIGGFILTAADKILGVLWKILSWFAHLQGMVWYQTVPHTWMLIAAVIGFIFLLSPVGMSGRYFGFLWLLPLVLYRPATPAAGEVWFTLLDIGQGLSAVVQTQKHMLVFDAGPKLGASFDMGDSVVVPFLHSLHARQVDMLVISHGDNDHIGGAQAVISQMRVAEIKTSVPDLLPSSTYCLRGQSWVWDGVAFSFLYPSTDMLDLDNDSSCVLKISSGTQNILLTGDIEKEAERDLLKNSASELQANILVAPHHGSKTSGLKKFVARVNPKVVLYAIGYRNRYHFPHPSIVKEYKTLGAIQLDTPATGAIKFVMNEKNFSSPELFRLENRHYWNN